MYTPSYSHVAIRAGFQIFAIRFRFFSHRQIWNALHFGCLAKYFVKIFVIFPHVLFCVDRIRNENSEFATRKNCAQMDVNVFGGRIRTMVMRNGRKMHLENTIADRFRIRDAIESHANEYECDWQWLVSCAVRTATMPACASGVSMNM